MVIKTEPCTFSEFKIYPGKGQRYVAKDGRTSYFITKKARQLALKKVKAQKITWTISWRRHNKKISTDEQAKKKKKRAVKVQRAIVGISLDEIRRKRAEKPEIRQAQREQAIREIKERKQKALDQKRKATGQTVGKKPEQKATKQQKGAQTQQPKTGKVKK